MTPQHTHQAAKVLRSLADRLDNGTVTLDAFEHENEQESGELTGWQRLELRWFAPRKEQEKLQ